MRRFQWAVFGLMVLGSLAINGTTLADSYSGAIEVFKNSPQVQSFFENAYGYAFFPSVGKGGFVVGGAYGKGLVYQAGRISGKTTIIKVSVGLQMGGQAFSEIIFFQDKRAYDEFTSGSFEFDATASAVAITAGVQAQAGTAGASAGTSTGKDSGMQVDTGYYKGMAVFVHAKGGLMFEAAIGGQKFSFQPQ